jgi:hypothetical protein
VSKTVNSTFYLKFSRDMRNDYFIKLKGCPEAYMNKPKVGPGEIAVKMSIDVPESLFTEPEIVIRGVLPEASNREVVMQRAEEAASLVSEMIGFKIELQKGESSEP